MGETVATTRKRRKGGWVQNEFVYKIVIITFISIIIMIIGY